MSKILRKAFIHMKEEERAMLRSLTTQEMVKAAIERTENACINEVFGDHEEPQSETVTKDGAGRKRKQLKSLQRETTEGLMLIYELLDHYKINYLDELPSIKAWGKIVSMEFKSDLIKQVTGTRRSTNIELNGGDKLDRKDFVDKYRKRFE